MRDKSIKLITTFLVLLFLSSIFNFPTTDIKKTENFPINIKENKPKTSKFWNLTGSPISIDDNDPSKNWSYTALHYDWCSGSGAWTDPYVIENATIDGQGSGNCIEIKNSDTYFIIRNCSLNNSGSSNNAGIKLDNVDNGKIINDNCSNNNFIGIYLMESNNNTLLGNTANNNKFGIYLDNSDNNTLSGNTASNNHDNGIGLSNSDNNNLSGNNASNHNNRGILLNESNNNTISGNTASNNNRLGIYLEKSNNNSISGNTASNNDDDGIHLWYSNNNSISGNTASNNYDVGIYLMGSDNNTLSGNTANNNIEGINLWNGENNTLSGNLMNFCGIFIYGSLADEASHIIDDTNLVNNKPVYYYVNELGLGSSNFTDAGQIILINCSNSIISGFNLSNSTTGIYLGYSNNNILSGNTANNNDYGIYLYDSNNNTLSGNIANNNSNYGIYLIFSDNNTLSGNIANNNSNYGIYLIFSDNNTLSGNTANNNDETGIYFWQSDINNLSGNTASNNDDAGIYLYNSNNNNLSGNTASINDDAGIYLYNSNDNNLSGNTASNNDDAGIYLYNSIDNMLSGNLMKFCGITLYGSLAKMASHSIDDTNLVNNKPVYYYVNELGLGSSNFTNAGQIILINCSNSIISGLNLSNGTTGIYLYNSNNNTLSGNTASNNNDYGIYLYNSNNNTLSGNTVSNNDDYGIYLYYSNNNTLSGNTASNKDDAGMALRYIGICLSHSNNNNISGNTASNNFYGIHLGQSNNNSISGNTANNNFYGIRIYYSFNNTLSGNIIRDNNYGTFVDGNIDSTPNLFFNNYFITNSIHAYDNGRNTYWDNGTMGNYWDDYNGEDSNNDGIGSIPYNISGPANSQDNYPIWWDSIIISINTPNSNEFFGTITPNFTISIDKGLARTTWYTIDNGLTNITFTGFTGAVDQTEWDKISSGFVTLTFYANNTLGVISSSEVVINKDITPPAITIISPEGGAIFGTSPPTYNIDVNDANLDTMWYTIDNGITNITFTGSIGIIDQIEWAKKGHGTVTIRFYANDTLGGIGYTEVVINKDITPPAITIISPEGGDIFGTNPPIYSIDVNDANLDTMWYTIDNGITNNTFTGSTGIIDQIEWAKKGHGTVTIRFYAIDTIGNIGFAEVTIKKDVTAPIITINNPQNNDIFGVTAPSFNISINEPNIDRVWYSLNSGTNIAFTGITGTINQALWDALPEGNVVIKFYANNSIGNIGFTEVTIKKDVTAPIITINSPQNNDVIGATAPSFNISINEPNLDKVWYSLNGGTNITFTGLTGTINQALWDALPEGNVVIRFYANDSAGNIGFQEVTVVKEITQTIPPEIPGYDILFLVGIISVIVVIIIKKRIKNSWQNRGLSY